MTDDNKIEIRVKNIDLNIEKDIRFLLANEHKYLLPCEIEETDDECIFHFDGEGMHSFEEVKRLRLDDKYRLLLNIAGMEELTSEYYVNLSPQNLVYDINLVPKLLIRDKKSEIERADFFEQYRALAAGIILGKYSFEQYYNGGAQIPEKSFLKRMENTKELQNELKKKYLTEKEINNNQKLLVKKNEYKRMKHSLPIAVIVCAAALAYGLYMQFIRVPYQNKIISAYSGYLKSDYIYVEDTLKDINVKELPADVKYILARSYIFTEGLTTEQRENLLEYTGINIDSNVFDFWISLGRGDFAAAEDIAKKIGNNEFLLFTYIKHNAYLKSDVTISGEDKAELTKELDQKISDLSESMESTEEAETEQSEPMEATETSE